MKKTKISLKTLENRAKNEIKTAKDLKELDGILSRYLGKKGELTLVLRSLKDLPEIQKAKVGKEANDLKMLIIKEVEEKKKKMGLAGFFGQEQEEEWFDITVPGKKPVIGHLHPLTQAKREVEEIFQSMGFFVAEGPETENDWYNFDALNIPKDHPARDQWDTFWIKNLEGQKSKNQKLLLRTHTSPVQIRYMENHKPPLRIIAPGNVFRHEATDASHEFQLSQVEGLMVDKDVSAANFKATIREFFKRFFSLQDGKEVKIRLRPDFFPFTEPSFDVSINCLVCGGKGCPACKNSGWVELAGAGMVHPNVFKAAGLDPKDWTGWAFGFGLERLTMMKYKINDIRLFRMGDSRFLNQF